MKDILKNHIEKIEKIWNELPYDILIEFNSRVTEETVKNKTYILSSGEICKYIFIIKSGSAWKFYVHNGKKIATEFAFSGDLIYSVPSYTLQIKSKEYIQVLENSVIQKIEFGKFESIKLKSEKLILLDSLISEYQILKLEDRLYSIQFQSAINRLKWLIDREPELLKKVPGRYIASYLGITLETLIRLKKSLI